MHRALTTNQNDLKRPGRTEPLGITYQPDLLSEKAELRILSSIERLPYRMWESIRMRGQLVKRRTISFGWRYQIYKRTLTPAPEMLPFVRELRDNSARSASIDASSLDQAVIIRYPVGAGIGPHIDAACFGPVVLDVSLVSACEITFTLPRVGQHRKVLEPRSLLVLRGDARYRWKHELPEVRRERISILFRSRVGEIVG